MAISDVAILSKAPFIPIGSCCMVYKMYVVITIFGIPFFIHDMVSSSTELPWTMIRQRRRTRSQLQQIFALFIVSGVPCSALQTSLDRSSRVGNAHASTLRSAGSTSSLGARRSSPLSYPTLYEYCPGHRRAYARSINPKFRVQSTSTSSGEISRSSAGVAEASEPHEVQDFRLGVPDLACGL